MRSWRLASSAGLILAGLLLPLQTQGQTWVSACSEPIDSNACIRFAEQGHVGAQFILGFFYSTGRGVPQDDGEAVKWYRRAAEQGEAVAQFILGNRYTDGRGVPQDDREAVKWYRRAAEQGDADAQFRLGVMYGTGRGCYRTMAKP